MINVVKPYLPPLEEYNKYLEGIWERAWLTNHGPLVGQLESQLKEYLGVKHVMVVASGTVALQIIIRSLELQGEVLTTSFSHVAAVNALIWANCKPIFVDIDKEYFCIDVSKIEASITSRTSALLATHVYGYPCQIKQIRSIAEKYKLKIIYDAAHAFGVKVHNRSIFNYGDVSAASFHATKLYHTIEGGAIVTNDEEIARKCILLRNFGLDNTDPHVAGINGKNSEFHAAMGLCILPKVAGLIHKRHDLSKQYRTLLKNLPLQFPAHPCDIEYNYAYFPVLFHSGDIMICVQNALAKEEIYARRYFYPSLNKLPYHKGTDCPVAEDVSQRILCLPLYHDLTGEDVEHITRIIAQQLCKA